MRLNNLLWIADQGPKAALSCIGLDSSRTVCSFKKGFGTGNDLRPVMSPNGMYIAFTSDESGERTMWLLTTNGNANYPVQSHPLKQKPGLDFSPPVPPTAYAIWKPDSKSILYSDTLSNLVAFYLNVTVLGYQGKIGGIGGPAGSTQLGNAVVCQLTDNSDESILETRQFGYCVRVESDARHEPFPVHFESYCSESIRFLNR